MNQGNLVFSLTSLIPDTGTGQRALSGLTFSTARATIPRVKRISVTVVIVVFIVIQLLAIFCFGIPMPSSSIAATLPGCSEEAAPSHMVGCEQLGISCWLGFPVNAHQSKRLGLTQEDRLSVADIVINGLSLNLASIPGHIAPNAAPISSIYLKSYSVLNL